MLENMFYALMVLFVIFDCVALDRKWYIGNGKYGYYLSIILIATGLMMEAFR